MNAKSILLRLALLAAAPLCMAPGCDGDVLNDSTFRLWCGQTLCDWKLDEGHVKQAGTWHPDDYGVELVDAPTRISQDSDQGATCMEFSAVADVDASALAKVQVDFNFDGVPDVDSPIAETHWGRTSTLIYAPENYGSRLRFTVRKDGVGRAVLAEIRLQIVDKCTGPRPVLRHVGPRVECLENAECESGTCAKADAGTSFGTCT